MSSGGKGNSKANTSSQTSTVTESTTINTVDNRAVQGDNAVIGGNVTVNSGDASQVSISTTDQGAVKAGLDVALESLDTVQRATSGAYETATDLYNETTSTLESIFGKMVSSVSNSASATQSVASDSIKQAYDLAQEARQSETSGAINNMTKYVLWIVIAGIAAWVIVKTRK